MKKTTIKLVGKKERAYINIPYAKIENGSIFITENSAMKIALTASYWELNNLRDENCFGDSPFYLCDTLDATIDIKIKMKDAVCIVDNMHELVETMRNANGAGSISVTFI